jgi:hypothetical protein
MTLEQLVMNRLIPKPLSGEVPLGPRRTEVLEWLRGQSGTTKNFAAGARALGMTEGTFTYHVVQLAQQEVIRIVYFDHGSAPYPRHIVVGNVDPVAWKPGVHTSRRVTRYRQHREVGSMTLPAVRRAHYMFEVSFTVVKDGVWVTKGSGPFVE